MNIKVLLVGVIIISASCNTEVGEENQNRKQDSYGMVSSATPEASDAAVLIMNQGGNAIDAAIAASFVLGVTEPAMSGLGGGTQIIMALPGEVPISINGATLSPSSTPYNTQSEDLVYHRRSTIPSTVKVMGYIFEKYGSGKISWQDLLAPAISYAQNGFSLGVFRHKVYKNYEAQLKKSPFNTSYFLLANGSIPAAGDTLKQPILARTLQRLAIEGADDFYHGQIASQIADDMKTNGGWITLEDLNNFPDPEELAPVHTNFRGFDVYSQPPPCGGWTALLILNILEQYSKEELQPNTESRFVKVLEAIHLGHKDRQLNPIQDGADLEKRLSKDYAKDVVDNFSNIEKTVSEEGGETTHFSVVDRDGMAVAVTSSINAYFGAAAASPELGFLYNTYMNDFELGISRDHPFAIGPWRMNYSSMSPTIVQRDNETQLVIGSPGSARIISSVAQLIQLWADTDMDINEIVAYPRLHSVNDKIYYEDLNMPNSWVNEMRKKGFEITFPNYTLADKGLNAYFGGIHALSRKNNLWDGASDPRRDGKSTKTN